MGSTDYAYISSKIKALETLLPDKIDIERMIDSPSFEEAFKVLNDTSYASNLLDVNPRNFNEALNKDFSELKNLLLRELPSPEVREIIFLKADWHNIKTILKAKFFEKEIDKNMFVTIGNISYSALINYIMEGKSDTKIPDYLSEAITLIEKKQENGPTPESIDLLGDREYHKEILMIAKKTGNKGVIDYVKLRTDHANIKITVRLFIMEKPASFTEHFLIEGGNISVQNLVSAYSENKLESITELLKKHLHAKTYPYLEKLEKEKTLKYLEKALDMNLSEFIDSLKYVSFGPEVVISYFQKKINAIKNVRMILKGKLNEMPREEIKFRLLKPY